MDRETFKAEIFRMYKESGKFPKIQEMSVMIEQPTYKVTQILRELVKEGFLLRVGNWYKFPSQQEILKPVKEEKKKVKKELPPIPPADKLTTGLIRWSLGLIGLGMVIISAFYTQVWMALYVPEFLAWAFAIFIVGFSVMAFEAGIHFRSQNMKGVGIVFFILWGIVVLFSIGSTIAGQYNKVLHDDVLERQKTRTTDTNAVFYKLKEADRVRIEQSLNKKQGRQQQVLKLLEPYDLKPQDEAYDSFKAEYNKIDNDIKALSKEYKTVSDEIQKLIGADPALLAAQVENESFFTWLAKIMGTDSKNIQFWMYLLPAILIDLLAPIGIAVFLFLGKKSYNIPEEDKLND